MGQYSSKIPPGPWNPLTIMKIPQSAAEVLTDLSRQYGPVFSFRLFVGPLTVVLNNNAVIREALLDNADAFPNRMTSPLRKSWGLRGRVFYSVGEDQKTLRSFVIQGLHEFQKTFLPTKVSEEARHLCVAFEKKQSQPFDPTEYLSLAASNIMALVNFGQRYEYDDPKFKELVETLDYLFYALRPGTLVHAHPWLYDTFLYKSLKSSQEYVKNYVKEEIEKHEKDLDPSNPRDFIDYYLIKAGEEESEEDPLFLVDRAWYTIKDIFSSASNPGSAAVQWLIALFCNFQEEQDKVYEEVISVIGDSRLPTFEDMKKMPYTHAFLQEALRFRSAVPFGTREAARDVDVGGYTIPKGSNILVNYWAVERDPDVWNKPEEFRPERFLEADKKTPVDLPHHIPLGVGHRNCLGQTLALMEMFLFSTNLLQKFRLEFSPSDPKPPLRGVSGATVVVENFKLCAKKR